MEKYTVTVTFTIEANSLAFADDAIDELLDYAFENQDVWCPSDVDIDYKIKGA